MANPSRSGSGEGLDSPLMGSPLASTRRRSASRGDQPRQRTWSASGALARLTSRQKLEATLGQLLQDEGGECDGPFSLDADAPAGSPGSTPWPRADSGDRFHTGSASPLPAGPCLSVRAAVARVPGVMIGTTMNIMLSVPFGLAMFPTGWDPMPYPRAMGLQMFLFSTFICQVCMTLFSEFPCSMGMMMVENIPFMHTIAEGVIRGQGTGADAMATTMMAFAISTVLMGSCFFLLGRFKLGKAVSYFPRHFLIGCIGGIGIFVTQTGFEVSTNVPWAWTWESVERYGSADLLPLSLTSVALVIVLNVALRLVHWTLLPPCFFVGIIPAFYIVLLAMGVSVDVAREQGWIFPFPPTTDLAVLWDVFNVHAVRWDLIFIQTPTLVALTCFGLMHAPINIPSLSMSTGVEVDMNRELMVHGASNLASGLLGGLPNYLCYSNSLLYPREASALLPIPGGTLLIHVGLDLSKEALVDSLEGFDTFEYSCVVLITITMTIFGMTTGLGFGLVLSAVSFTLQNMRHCEPVRGVMPATTLRSSAKRTSLEREVLKEGMRHVEVVQLQGTIFFGNATVLSSRVEEMLAAKRSIKALVLDFTLVRSLESSAAETIAKIYAIARRHDVAVAYNRGDTEGFPTSAPLSRRLADLKREQVQNGSALHVSDELDDALMWAEELILQHARQAGELGVPAAVVEEGGFGEEGGHEGDA
ncbi:unnamed protein product, partial [Prorocentrum cordatum]